MGTALTGTEIKDTYDSLIKITDNGPISGTLKALSDGLGNDSALALSTGAASITGTLAVSGATTLGVSTALNWGARGGIAQDGSYNFSWSTNGVANVFNIESATGNVGIGTSSPARALAVNGIGKFTRTVTLGANDGTTSFGAYITNEAFANNASTSEFTIGTGSGLDIPIILATNATERMRIDSAGLVGIGTSSPSSFATLTINKNGASEYSGVITTNANSTAALSVGVGGSSVGATALRNNAYILNTAASDLILGTSDTERMRITSAGKIGINTTSALGQLNIRNESAGATTNALALYNAPSNTQNTGVAIEFYPNVGVDDRCARISSVNPTTTGTNLSDLRFFTSNNAAPTEKMRITHTGAVGIGTDSPSGKLNVYSTEDVQYSASTFASDLTISRVNTSGNNQVVGLTFITTGDSGVTTGAAAISAEQKSLLSSADLVFQTRSNGTRGERMRILAGGGLTFNGDTAAANALDDYEEGTFTATLTPETSGSITGSATYTTWTYTKIGRQVTINGVFVVSAVSSPVGNFIKLSGLPFAVLSVNGAYGSFSAMFTDASAGSAKSSLPSWHSIAVSEIWMSIDASTIAANDEFYVTATYFV